MKLYDLLNIKIKVKLKGSSFICTVVVMRGQYILFYS